ncbi:phosphatidylinositol-specific phospholipase C/glycerophosphodiester phosphodiesterase family protein [Brevibacillus migulae]|uniref:phosphatidylinositol-specific phospholipase C/glycerophosphodiester phosphodiesterase family protein n=1 Tax=Brevibacillus migulae TaxID=1644114 RepID=UPI00106EF67B|nr:phosphatidylinositol-specific phospholipase C/glycerophosphodiester phosphodiesterase family protein [Brevibacillus migulae]
MRRFLQFFLLLLSIFYSTSVSEAAESQTKIWSDYTLIAHAFGGVAGNTYTNSYEAFIANYDKGQRVFEVDLILTSDNYLVARHDWSESFTKMLQQDISSSKGQPLSYDEIRKYKIMKRYTMLEFSEIAKILKEYPDIYIVTDTKDTEKLLVERQFNILVNEAKKVDVTILKRIIPQIYNQEMFATLENIHSFDNYIYTLYQSKDTNDQVIKFVSNNNIAAITMPTFKANVEFVSKLKEEGIPVYVHTLNNLDEMKKFKDIGVHGFYTDFVTYKDIDHYNLEEKLRQTK